MHGQHQELQARVSLDTRQSLYPIGD
jgi:hypothetical protein